MRAVDIKDPDKSDFYATLFSVKFIYYEKATKFCEISSLLLTSKVEISKKFVVFSEYMNFSIVLSCEKKTGWFQCAKTIKLK